MRSWTYPLYNEYNTAPHRVKTELDFSDGPIEMAARQSLRIALYAPGHDVPVVLTPLQPVASPCEVVKISIIVETVPLKPPVPMPLPGTLEERT